MVTELFFCEGGRSHVDMHLMLQLDNLPITLSEVTPYILCYHKLLEFYKIVSERGIVSVGTYVSQGRPL